MSISQSVGAISKYLGYLTSGQHYLRVKDRAKSLLKSLPGVGWPIIRAGRAVEEMVKKTFFPGLVFEELGLRYIGPVQGHSLRSLLEVFEEAKTESDGPVLIHCVTRKGRGYVPAQDSPDHFHGASPFDVESGEPAAPGAKPSYSDVFGETMIRIAGEDDAGRGHHRGHVARGRAFTSTPASARTSSSTSGSPSSTPSISPPGWPSAASGRSAPSIRRFSSGRTTRSITTSASRTSRSCSPSTGPASSPTTARPTRASTTSPTSGRCRTWS